ncbi:hypothetical protein RRG08_023936 [Elysia crispata]|uniref:Uncharacterized protein n=1 Tax=Elysia crispata TaxID=231223 RepID=A0AAE0YM76_9GAST|nr:hypothetical protein RRG08_023936 [Elysia crispata]
MRKTFEVSSGLDGHYSDHGHDIIEFSLSEWLLMLKQLDCFQLNLSNSPRQEVPVPTVSTTELVVDLSSSDTFCVFPEFGLFEDSPLLCKSEANL